MASIGAEQMLTTRPITPLGTRGQCTRFSSSPRVACGRFVTVSATVTAVDQCAGAIRQVRRDRGAAMGRSPSEHNPFGLQSPFSDPSNLEDVHSIHGRQQLRNLRFESR